MLLRGETNFFVHSLRHHSVLIFNFSDIKCGYKLKSKDYIKVVSKSLRNERTLRYQKNYLQLSYNSTELLMLKQGVKTMLNVFKHVHYPNFLSFISDLMQPCCQGFFSF